VQRDARTGEVVVMAPVVEPASGGRIVRGDLRRKPVSLAAFEGNVRTAARRQAR
jgi:hypothetical protein